MPGVYSVDVDDRYGADWIPTLIVKLKFAEVSSKRSPPIAATINEQVPTWSSVTNPDSVSTEHTPGVDVEKDKMPSPLVEETSWKVLACIDTEAVAPSPDEMVTVWVAPTMSKWTLADWEL